MADKISQSDVIDSSVLQSFQSLNKELIISVKLMTDLTKASIDMSKNFNPNNIQQVVASQAEYNKVSEDSQKQNKQTADTLEKLRQKIKEVNEEEERAKIAIQEKRKAIRDSIKAQKDQSKETVILTRELQKEIKTEKEAADQNKKLIKIRKEVDTTTAKGAKQVDLINEKIDKNNSLIKNNASGLEKQKIGIGNYKEGVTEALKEQEVFGLSINKIGGALKSGAGIVGAITAVLVGLGKAYASSARGAEDMARAHDRLNSITTKLGNSLADADGEGGFFDSVFRGIQQQLLGIASTIESDIIVGVKSTIRELGILEADQERQKKTQLDAAEQLRQIRDDERKSFEERKAANDELVNVINAREQETIAFQEKKLKNYKTLLAFDEGNIEIQREIKQIEFEIADAREEAQGLRSEQQANDLALSKEYAANEIELQKIILEGRIATVREGSLEEFKLKEELINKTKELELQAAGENEQLQQIAIEKAKNANDGLLREYKNHLANLKAAQDEYNLEKLNSIVTQSKKEIESKLDADEAEFDLFVEQQEALTDVEIEEINKRAEARIKADEDKKRSVEEWTNYAIDEARNLSSSILNFLDSQISAQEAADIEKAESRGASEEEIAKIEEKAAKKRKNVALADAAIYTALAITKALFTSSTWVEGLIAAVLLAAEGALQIAAIENASFAKGTNDSGDDWLNATVAEKGREKVILKDGSSFYTPNKQSKMLLPPHSEIIPNHQLQNELAEVQAYGNKSIKSEDNKRQEELSRELIKTVKNKKETTLNITENGIGVTAKKGNNFYKYISRKYRD